MEKKSYSEMLSLNSFKERFEYLKLSGSVGLETFGYDRYINQEFYSSPDWKSLRNKIIIRDEGCDLADPDRPIHGPIHIHHINPITEDDINRSAHSLWDPENLVCTSFVTHNAIHYGNSSSTFEDPVERFQNDTCPWKVVKPNG